MPRSPRTYLWLCACVLLGCDVYDASKLTPRAGTAGTGSPMDSGVHRDAAPPPVDAGDEDGGMCTMQGAELCNLVDDDCDGHTDEDTVKGCEAVIANGDAECLELLGSARCVLLGCHSGFSNCDGDPTNGCEAPYCMCHPCPDEDAGSASDAGQ